MKLDLNSPTGRFSTFNYFLFNILINLLPITKKSLHEFCLKESNDLIISFEGLIGILKFLNIIVEKNSILYLSKKIKRFENDDAFCVWLIKALLDEIEKRKLQNDLFPIENIKFDIPKASISIISVPLDLYYRSLRDFFIELKFWSRPPFLNNVLLIENKYRNLFENVIKNRNASEVWVNNKYRKFSPQILEAILEKRNKNGILAENFALAYEKKINKNHPLRKMIELISRIDISAGFDLVSFACENSRELDKFIEVKAYTQGKKFYWTRNEIDKARIFSDNYFIYLIDIREITKNDYIPTIIRNPYKKFMIEKEGEMKTEILSISGFQ